MHVDNKNKDILIFGKGATDGLHDTALTAEKNVLHYFYRA